jgi:hypothetical protein
MKDKERCDYELRIEITFCQLLSGSKEKGKNTERDLQQLGIEAKSFQ